MAMSDTTAASLASQKIAIATAKRRKAKFWHNTSISWHDLVKRLATTVRTAETVAEYGRLPKSRRDDIKDVGGFVGGSLKAGRRTVATVAWRQLVTLDADFAAGGAETFWASAQQALVQDGTPCAGLVYSTHKHTPEHPRLRLVVPLSRPVSPDEYQAIARRIADDIGIDQFDDSTYQAHRLMYWPSTPRDGEFFTRDRSGAWYNADACLATYEDWRDQSYWPMSTRVDKVALVKAKKQEDPLSKPGVIGAFCRTYTISQAIDKFLLGVYTPCGIPDRYTYAAGSTSAGAIVYDDKFLYSHHATDPVGSMLVNAYDLVRIHKFGYLDADAEGSGSQLPSFKAMQEFAAADKGTRITLGREERESVDYDFGNLAEPDEDDGGGEEDWMGALDRDGRSGKILTTPRNIKIILNNDERLKDRMGLDTFAHKWTALRPMPWGYEGIWRNDDDSMLRNYLAEIYGVTGRDTITDAVVEVMYRHSFNSVQNYLDRLTWDGERRLETLFIDYLGAEDTPFNRTITRKALTAAVNRIYEPGCKYDYVLTLLGAQGSGKSTILKKLAGRWCSDSLTTLSGKEAMEAIQGDWIIELAELSAIKKSELEATKQFITKQVDEYRPAYGRHKETYPRQCIFVATTNEDAFIRDQTGGRRWWPMRVNRLHAKYKLQQLTQDTVDQIWAEAKACYKAGEALYLDDANEAIASALQDEHTEQSPLMGPIGDYLDKLLPDNWDNLSISDRQSYIAGDAFATAELKGTVRRDRVCAMEIWVELLHGDPKRLDRTRTYEINGILRKMPGWEPTKSNVRFAGYGKQRGFIRTLEVLA